MAMSGALLQDERFRHCLRADFQPDVLVRPAEITSVGEIRLTLLVSLDESLIHPIPDVTSLQSRVLFNNIPIIL